MTPLETLQKYGLETDVKSIKERYLNNDYRDAFPHKGIWPSELEWRNTKEELRAADLALLCSLAEKGERVNAWGKESLNAIERAWVIMNDHGAETTEEITLVRHAIRIAREVTKSYDIITESEGEPQ